MNNEIEVPGLDETIFIVADSEQGKALVAKGIKRGRIWTNKEVERLKSQNPTVDEARKVAMAKLLYDARMVEPQETLHASLFDKTEKGRK